MPGCASAPDITAPAPRFQSLGIQLYATWLTPLRICERTCACHREPSGQVIDGSVLGETRNSTKEQIGTLQVMAGCLPSVAASS